jgi:hypothetical protein
VPVEIKEVKSRKELRQFIYLPANIHRDHTQWVPPIYVEEWKYFNSYKNRAFSYCDTILFLAIRNGEPQGRIMGIINHRYNSYRQEKYARFSCLECRDDRDVSHGLLEHVEGWARQKKMVKIVGPMGFSDQDPEGFLVEGFEHTPTLATYCNYEFIPRLIEKEGYAKEVDYVVYKVNLLREIPEFYKRIYQRLSQRKDFKLGEFDTRKQLKKYIRPVFSLMNECFKDIYGYLPLNEKEMGELAQRYLPLVDPRFVKIVVKNDLLIGFIIGIPNFSEGIRKAQGRLFPFGLFHILRSAKRTKQLDLLLGGIKEEYRGRGIDVMLGLKFIESGQKAGFEYIDSHHELESNLRMRAEMERLGGEAYKRFRIYQKSLV